MKIKVSKVFAKFISDTCKERGIAASACVCEFGDMDYRFTVGDEWDAIEYGDYNRDGKLIALCVSYPADYYACPAYVSTKALLREFRLRGVSTWDELKDMVCDMFEI